MNSEHKDLTSSIYLCSLFLMGSILKLKTSSQDVYPIETRPAGMGVEKYLFALFSFVSMTCFAQDPVLPPTNLGMANIYDGMAGKPGLVFQGFTQVFQTRSMYDAHGKGQDSELKINSIVQLNQLIYLSPIKVLGGNLAFTVLAPMVQITSSEMGTSAPQVNPAIFGDLIQGTAIQWSDKELFGKKISHRAEFDLSIPTGNYSSDYHINPSSHNWGYSVYHAFTLMFNEHLSMSARNQFNYNGKFIGSTDKAGAYYNGNYSIEYSLTPAVKVEAVAYYLTQLTEDSREGDHHYFQSRFGMNTTKEKVLGLGPGLAYFVPGGILIEGKVFFETAGQNRLTGTRPTLRILIPLSK